MAKLGESFLYDTTTSKFLNLVANHLTGMGLVGGNLILEKDYAQQAIVLLHKDSGASTKIDKLTWADGMASHSHMEDLAALTAGMLGGEILKKTGDSSYATDKISAVFGVSKSMLDDAVLQPDNIIEGELESDDPTEVLTATEVHHNKHVAAMLGSGKVFIEDYHAENLKKALYGDAQKIASKYGSSLLEKFAKPLQWKKSVPFTAPPGKGASQHVKVYVKQSHGKVVVVVGVVMGPTHTIDIYAAMKSAGVHDTTAHQLDAAVNIILNGKSVIDQWSIHEVEKDHVYKFTAMVMGPGGPWSKIVETINTPKPLPYPINVHKAKAGEYDSWDTEVLVNAIKAHGAATPPANPTHGDLWWNGAIAQLYEFKNLHAYSHPGQWVMVDNAQLCSDSKQAKMLAADKHAASPPPMTEKFYGGGEVSYNKPEQYNFYLGDHAEAAQGMYNVGVQLKHKANTSENNHYPTSDGWHHVVFQKIEGTHHLFIDGKLESIMSMPTTYSIKQAVAEHAKWNYHKLKQLTMQAEQAKQKLESLMGEINTIAEQVCEATEWLGNHLTSAEFTYFGGALDDPASVALMPVESDDPTLVQATKPKKLTIGDVHAMVEKQNGKLMNTLLGTVSGMQITSDNGDVYTLPAGTMAISDEYGFDIEGHSMHVYDSASGMMKEYPQSSLYQKHKSDYFSQLVWDDTIGSEPKKPAKAKQGGQSVTLKGSMAAGGISPLAKKKGKGKGLKFGG